MTELAAVPKRGAGGSGPRHQQMSLRKWNLLTVSRCQDPTLGPSFCLEALEGVLPITPPAAVPPRGPPTVSGPDKLPTIPFPLPLTAPHTAKTSLLLFLRLIYSLILQRARASPRQCNHGSRGWRGGGWGQREKDRSGLPAERGAQSHDPELRT